MNTAHVRSISNIFNRQENTERSNKNFKVTIQDPMVNLDLCWVSVYEYGEIQVIGSYWKIDLL